MRCFASLVFKHISYERQNEPAMFSNKFPTVFTCNANKFPTVFKCNANYVSDGTNSFCISTKNSLFLSVIFGRACLSKKRATKSR